ncbi:hypothetical protein [Psychroserpens sp. SPM9]|uniref:OB-fold protein n=1 Tax=Psychroserpens sp. SPM9 TaxID=2975598 RepID=UPI0021A3B64F|nr:hypothetical protein [Psychroserpens sp. SPM9]MDG5492114.1 hypothetical protein [Psychroserpens sp. SPM9]
MRKRIIIFIVLIILSIIGYNYIYQDHRNIENESAQFEISTHAIALQFKENAKDAEAKYLNTTVAVFGSITEKDSNAITLDDKVFCQFSKTIKNENTLTTKLKIKGRVIGYDDLLEQVKLDQCTINKP